MTLPVLQHLDTFDTTTLASLTDEALGRLAQDVLTAQTYSRQMDALRTYVPVNAEAAKVHTTTATTIGIFGGNGSSKTETALVELCIRATGHIPASLIGTYPLEKLRGPINCRIVCESLNNTLESVILPKLNWQRWQGVDRPGGPRGHFGWIPKHHLIKGEWKESYKERTRTLQVLYRDPVTDAVEGVSTIQFMSYDQDPSDFASGDFHFILHDEPPKYAIWRENRARVMRVNGTLAVAMTWPDDATLPVDWILDEVVERAQPGPRHDPDTFCITLFSTDNPNLNQDAVASRARQMTPMERATRIYGQPIRLSNRVHPLFTDAPRWWCFVCNDLTILDSGHKCGTCGSDNIVEVNHVQNLKADPGFPVVNIVDPHPRKPHMLLWVQIDPNDDWHVIHEASIPGTPDDVMAQVEHIEGSYGWSRVRRLIDPNMGRSPSDTSREATWQDAFERVGLLYDLADDSDIGRTLINDALKPDGMTKRPRLLADTRCVETIYQMKRYLWDDHKLSVDKDQKQRAKPKHDDYPTCLKYLANSAPTFRGLMELGRVWKRNVGSYIG